MKLLKDNGHSYVYDDGDRIIKKFKPKQGLWLSEKWFEEYKRLHKNLTCLPKVISYIPQKEIVIEKVEGKTMREWLIDQYDLACKNNDSFHWGKSILECIKIVSNINNEFTNYSARVGRFVKHNDFTVNNVLVSSRNNYCLIDIESIIFDWAGSRVDSLAHIWLNDMYVHYMFSQFKLDSERAVFEKHQKRIKDVIENSINTN